MGLFWRHFVADWDRSTQEKAVLVALDRLSRWVAIVLVIAILFGALVLIGLGCNYTWEAIAKLIGLEAKQSAGPWAVSVKLAVLKAVDSFLFAIVLLYLAFGTYYLAFDPQGKEELPLLEIRSVADMKKTLLEVIAVLVAILFLQALVEHAGDLDWLLLIYPAAIIAIAIALKLIPFKH